MRLFIFLFSTLLLCSCSLKNNHTSETSLLGDYQELQPRDAYQGVLIYENPSLSLDSFHSILLDTPSIVAPKSEHATGEHSFTESLSSAFSNALKGGYPIVSAKGPHVLKVITNAQGEFVESENVVSLTLSALEIELKDSVTNKRVGALVVRSSQYYSSDSTKDALEYRAAKALRYLLDKTHARN